MHEKLPSINGLRALSVGMVITGHLGRIGLFSAASDNQYLRVGIDFVGDPALGVGMFLILSGFLITRLLLLEEQTQGILNIRNFYARRLLRIVPAYYFLLFIYYLAQRQGYLYIGPNSWFTALTFTKYLNWDADWYTAHGWSLSVEEQFYLIWPLVFRWGSKFRRYGCTALLVSVPFLRLYNYYVPTGQLNNLTLWMNVDALALGCLLACYRQPLVAAFRPGVWRVLAVGSVLVLLGLRYSNRLTAPVPQLNAIWGLLGQRHGTLAFLALGCLLLYSVYVARGPWFRFLNSKVLNFVGSISYGLYLWQQLFAVRPLFNTFLVNLAGIFTCAVFSYYVVERPFLRLKQQFGQP